MEICESETTLVGQLRHKISDLGLSDEMLQVKVLVRWLRARNGNLVAAEEMLRKNVEWRSRMNFEKIRTCKFPPEWETDVIPGFFLGEDKKGLPVLYMLFGRVDVERAIRSEGIDTLRSFILKYFECIDKLCLTRTKGKSSMGQITAIVDFQGLGFSKVTSYTWMQFCVEMLLEVLANYPEAQGKAFVLNTPWAFQVIYKVARNILDERTFNKISMLGSDKKIYREEIGKLVPFHAFPQSYGGDLSPEKEQEMKLSPNFDGTLSKWGPNNNPC